MWRGLDASDSKFLNIQQNQINMSLKENSRHISTCRMQKNDEKNKGCRQKIYRKLANIWNNVYQEAKAGFSNVLCRHNEWEIYQRVYDLCLYIILFKNTTH